MCGYELGGSEEAAVGDSPWDVRTECAGSKEPPNEHRSEARCTIPV